MKVALSLSASALAILIQAIGGAAQDREAARGSTTTVVACVLREADYARTPGTPPSQLLLADQSAAPTHVVIGLREAQLAEHVGRRVEVSGTLEAARTTPIMATVEGTTPELVKSEGPPAAGITPDGAAAHEPSDALTATVQAGSVPAPESRPSDPTYRIATLPRLNVTAVRRVDGACATPPRPAQVTSARARQEDAPAPPVATPRSAAAAPQTIVARGCLVRQTPEGGTALTPQSDSRDRFALTKALVVDSQRTPGGGVPGAVPSGGGSGTVPERGTPVATTGVNGMGTLTFALAPVSGNVRELTSRVGERVEVTGTTATVTANPRNDQTAHLSAPAQLITVTSFRVIGGRCD